MTVLDTELIKNAQYRLLENGNADADGVTQRYKLRKEYFQKRYLENRERILAYNKAWGESNRDKTAKAVRKMRSKFTSEELRIKWKSDYWKDAAKSVERQKRYANKHPELINHRVSQYRARKCKAHGRHTLEQWMSRVEFYGWRCAYCPKILTLNTLTKDHVVPLIRGGSNWASNLVPACRSCNASKHDKKLLEWRAS